MIVKYNSDFIDLLYSRLRKQRQLDLFNKRILQFTKNPQNRILQDHALVGKHIGFRAFSITKDIRVKYYLRDKKTAVFLDIGTHEQVYGEG